MKTIGQFLKQARLRKRYSIDKLAKETKIKRNFLTALESENWDDLPEYPVVTGFVKAYSAVVGAQENEALAILRRDYPPKPIALNPKPDLPSKIIFGPKIAFGLGVFSILAIVLGYLGYQYLKFIRPPSLVVFEPQEGHVVTESTVRVSGKTDTDAVVEINNQPVLLDQDGGFEIDLRIFEGTDEVVVVATSRSGKSSEIRHKIEVEENN